MAISNIHVHDNPALNDWIYGLSEQQRYLKQQLAALKEMDTEAHHRTELLLLLCD